MQKIDDENLDGVVGGTGGQQDSRIVEPAGTCPDCGHMLNKNTIKQITENGPWNYAYYECDKCGFRKEAN